jgi:hypothetical protein
VEDMICVSNSVALIELEHEKLRDWKLECRRALNTYSSAANGSPYLQLLSV